MIGVTDPATPIPLSTKFLGPEGSEGFEKLGGKWKVECFSLHFHFPPSFHLTLGGGGELGGKWISDGASKSPRKITPVRRLGVCCRFLKGFEVTWVTFGVTESHPRGSPSFSAHPPKTCSKSPGNERGWFSGVTFGSQKVTPENHPGAPPGGLPQVFEGF